jgi:hypothetical protein
MACNFKIFKRIQRYEIFIENGILKWGKPRILNAYCLTNEGENYTFIKHERLNKTICVNCSMEIFDFGKTLFCSELHCSVMVLQRFFVLVVLMQCEHARLVEEDFIADYFAYKRIHVLTTFTCSKHGMYILQFRKNDPHLPAL